MKTAQEKRAMALARERRLRQDPEWVEKRNAWRRANRAAHAIAQGKSPRKIYTPEERAEANKAKNAKWKAKNPDKVRARNTELKRKTRATLEGHKKSLKAAKTFREKNPEKVKSWSHSWFLKNREKAAANGHAYRARKAGAGGKFTPEDIANLMELQKGKCSWCLMSFGNEKPSIDHYIPLLLGGSNDPSNLRLLHKSCNSMKSSKHPVEFAKQNGLLCW